MTRSVTFRLSARIDLIDLYDFIAAEAGPQRAIDYAERLKVVCQGLAVFPERGRIRVDIGANVRSVAFKRRTMIAYLVTDLAVDILAVRHGGRPFEAE